MSNSYFVHHLALCETSNVGEGTKIFAFAHVMPSVSIGKQCQICDGVYIDSHVAIGDFVTIKNQAMLWEGVIINDGVFIGPGVIFTNDRYPRSPRFTSIPQIKSRYTDNKSWLLRTHVGEGVSIGAGAIILPGISIGQYAMIGAGACVIKDVRPFEKIVGNPGRFAGWVCYCGKNLLLLKQSDPDTQLTTCQCGQQINLMPNHIEKE